MSTNKYSRSNEDHNMSPEKKYPTLQSGDPHIAYKQVIVGLPGKASLRNNLEVLCVFQAAEIERLNRWVQEYRMKLSRIEKMNIDRVSYEMQIKELSEMLREKNDIELKYGELERKVQYLTKQNQELRERNPQSCQFFENYEILQEENILLKQKILSFQFHQPSKKPSKKAKGKKFKNIHFEEIHHVNEKTILFNQIEKLKNQEKHIQQSLANIIETLINKKNQPKKDSEHFDLTLKGQGKLFKIFSQKEDENAISTETSRAQVEILGKSEKIKRKNRKEQRKRNQIKQTCYDLWSEEESIENKEIRSKQIQIQVKKESSEEKNQHKIKKWQSENKILKKQIEELELEMLHRLQYYEEKIRIQGQKMDGKHKKELNEIKNENQILEKDCMNLTTRNQDLCSCIYTLQGKIQNFENQIQKENYKIKRIQNQNNLLKKQNSELNSYIQTKNDLYDKQIQHLKESKSHQLFSPQTLFKEYYQQASQEKNFYEEEITQLKCKITQMKRSMSQLQRQNSLLTKEIFYYPQKKKKSSKGHQSMRNKVGFIDSCQKQNVEVNQFEYFENRSKISERSEIFEEKILEMCENRLEELDKKNRTLIESEKSWIEDTVTQKSKQITERFTYELQSQRDDKYSSYSAKAIKLEDLLGAKQMKCEQLIGKIQMMKKYIEENDRSSEIQMSDLVPQSQNYENLKTETINLKSIISDFSREEKNQKGKKCSQERINLIYRMLELQHGLRNMLITYKKDYNFTVNVPSVEYVSNEELQLILNGLHEESVLLKSILEEKEKEKLDLQTLLEQKMQPNEEIEEIKKKYQISKQSEDLQTLEQEMKKLHRLYENHKEKTIEKGNFESLIEEESAIKYFQNKITLLGNKIQAKEEEIEELEKENFSMKKQLYKLNMKMTDYEKLTTSNKHQMNNLYNMISMLQDSIKKEKKKSNKLLDDNLDLKAKLEERLQIKQTEESHNVEDRIDEIMRKNYRLEDLGGMIAMVEFENRKGQSYCKELLATCQVFKSQIAQMRKQNQKLMKKYEKAKQQSHRSFKKLMLQHYRKVQQCKSAKRSFGSSDLDLDRVSCQVERLQTLIQEEKRQNLLLRQTCQQLKKQNEDLFLKNEHLEQLIKIQVSHNENKIRDLETIEHRLEMVFEDESAQKGEQIFI